MRVSVSVSVSAVAIPFFACQAPHRISLRISLRMLEDFIVGTLVRVEKPPEQFIFPFRQHITKRKHNKWTSYMDRENIFIFIFPSVGPVHANSHTQSMTLCGCFCHTMMMR